MPVALTWGYYHEVARGRENDGGTRTPDAKENILSAGRCQSFTKEGESK